jgi:hypothetical protein
MLVETLTERVTLAGNILREKLLILGNPVG